MHRRIEEKNAAGSGYGLLFKFVKNFVFMHFDFFHSFSEYDVLKKILKLADKKEQEPQTYHLHNLTRWPWVFSHLFL